MAARRARRAPRTRPAPRARAPRSRRRLRLLWLVTLVGVAAYLYYQPLSSYVQTRAHLEARQAEVEALRNVKAALALRLESTTSVEATRREARRIGFVRSGEQLFVVKGIPDWRRERRSLRRDG